MPITVVEWQALVGDLKISKKNVFEANLAVGYDQGVWLGRGAMKVLPAGFGLDLFLGGLSERGMMIGLDIDLPAPIPLGSTGLGLSGMGGDFAYNFVAARIRRRADCRPNRRALRHLGAQYGGRPLDGVPRSRITELCGTPTSGATTLALWLAAGAQWADLAVFWLDARHLLHVPYAAHCQVDLEDLVVVRPGPDADVLEIAGV